METSLTKFFTSPSIFFKNYIKKTKWIFPTLFYFLSVIIMTYAILPLSFNVMKEQPNVEMQILEQYRGLISGISMFTSILSTIGSTFFIVILIYIISKILSYKLRFIDIFNIYFWTKVPVGISNILIGAYLIIIKPELNNNIWVLVLISGAFGLWSTILMISAIKNVTSMKKVGLVISGSLLVTFWIASIVSSYNQFTTLG